MVWGGVWVHLDVLLQIPGRFIPGTPRRHLAAGLASGHTATTNMNWTQDLGLDSDNDVSGG